MQNAYNIDKAHSIILKKMTMNDDDDDDDDDDVSWTSIDSENKL